MSEIKKIATRDSYGNTLVELHRHRSHPLGDPRRAVG